MSLFHEGLYSEDDLATRDSFVHKFGQLYYDASKCISTSDQSDMKQEQVDILKELQKYSIQEINRLVSDDHVKNLYFQSVFSFNPLSPKEISVPKCEPIVSKKRVGCAHYQRNCQLQCPQCNYFFTCRFCHDKESNHNMDRKGVKRIRCILCRTEQDVSNQCINSDCKIEFGHYFCPVCKLYENTKEKKAFHCDQCGLCRVGNQSDFFHCDTCNACYTMSGRETHKCMPDQMKRDCPICLEDLFASRKESVILKCGHPIHTKCYKKYTQTDFRCPTCHTSIFTVDYQIIDQSIAANVMPEEYRKEVEIYCNDCQERCKTQFHFLGNQCVKCRGYNTVQV